MRELMFAPTNQSYKTTFFDTSPLFMTRAKPVEIIQISKAEPHPRQGIVVYSSDRPETPADQNTTTKPKEEKESLIATAFTTAKTWLTGGIANGQAAKPARPETLRKDANVPAGTSQH